MLIRISALIALTLRLALASPAQDPPEGSGASEPEFYHGEPDCDYTDRFCVWGALYDATGRTGRARSP